MIWKAAVLLSAAVCVLGHGAAISEQKVEMHISPEHRGHHGELAHIGSHLPEHHEEYAWSYPSYEFSYSVADPHTHDYKGQHEHRDGDEVRGMYWLLQPDGLKRVVKYKANKHTGFVADVRYEKTGHPVHHIEPVHHIPHKPHLEHIIHREEPRQEVRIPLTREVGPYIPVVDHHVPVFKHHSLGHELDGHLEESRSERIEGRREERRWERRDGRGEERKEGREEERRVGRGEERREGGWMGWKGRMERGEDREEEHGKGRYMGWLEHMKRGEGREEYRGERRGERRGEVRGEERGEKRGEGWEEKRRLPIPINLRPIEVRREEEPRHKPEKHHSLREQHMPIINYRSMVHHKPGPKVIENYIMEVRGEGRHGEERRGEQRRGEERRGEGCCGEEPRHGDGRREDERRGEELRWRGEERRRGGEREERRRGEEHHGEGIRDEVERRWESEILREIEPRRRQQKPPHHQVPIELYGQHYRVYRHNKAQKTENKALKTENKALNAENKAEKTE